MQGTNTFTFNKITMRKIVQHYFDTVLFKPDEAPEVTDVEQKQGIGSASFDVTTTSEDKE